MLYFSNLNNETSWKHPAIVLESKNDPAALNAFVSGLMFAYDVNEINVTTDQDTNLSDQEILALIATTPAGAPLRNVADVRFNALVRDLLISQGIPASTSEAVIVGANGILTKVGVLQYKIGEGSDGKNLYGFNFGDRGWLIEAKDAEETYRIAAGHLGILNTSGYFVVKDKDNAVKLFAFGQEMYFGEYEDPNSTLNLKQTSTDALEHLATSKLIDDLQKPEIRDAINKGLKIKSVTVNPGTSSDNGFTGGASITLEGLDAKGNYKSIFLDMSADDAEKVMELIMSSISKTGKLATKYTIQYGTREGSSSYADKYDATGVSLDGKWTFNKNDDLEIRVISDGFNAKSAEIEDSTRTKNTDASLSDMMIKNTYWFKPFNVGGIMSQVFVRGKYQQTKIDVDSKSWANWYADNWEKENISSSDSDERTSLGGGLTSTWGSGKLTSISTLWGDAYSTQVRANDYNFDQTWTNGTELGLSADLGCEIAEGVASHLGLADVYLNQPGFNKNVFDYYFGVTARDVFTKGLDLGAKYEEQTAKSHLDAYDEDSADLRRLIDLSARYALSEKSALTLGVQNGKFPDEVSEEDTRVWLRYDLKF